MTLSRSARWLKFIEQLKIRTNDEATGKPATKRLLHRHGQQQVWDTVAEKLDRLEPIRLIILKSRRVGISTQINSWLTTFIASADQVNALITAHKRKPAKEIWGMSKFFVTSSPLLSRLATIGNDTITIGRSQLRVTTAGTPESERGVDLTAWLADEAAFYERPEVWIATMQCLPTSDRVFSIGVIASTANGKIGAGEKFFDEWNAAQEGESDWFPIFLPWWKEPDYRLAGKSIEEATTAEMLLRQQYEVTDEQLAWRRWIIRNKLKNDEEMFHQEYPSSPNEAFIASGIPFFQSSQLQWIENDIRRGKSYRIDADGYLTEDPKGYLMIWRMPEMGHQYVVGADSAMGIHDAKGSDRHSRSAAEILDMDTLEQVGEYDAVTAPHLFAKHLAGMGRLYNNAILAPEVQSSGGGGGRELIVYLRETYEYWNIHKWRGQPDRIERQQGALLGWETNSRTRPRMLARVREVIMERSVILHSRRLLNQLENFGETDEGFMEAQAGRDDLLFAYGIALMSRTENYYKMPAQGPVSTEVPDWSHLGIRVLRQETPMERLRRILQQQDPTTDIRQRSFLEL